MSGTSDLYRGFVTSPLDGAGLVDFKQLWMERSPIELKNQFRNFGSDR